MLALVDKTGSTSIIDLGSGWGHFVIRAAKRYPHRNVIGYELSLMPWLVSALLKKIFSLTNLTLHRQNFDLAKLTPASDSASVLVCYLFPRAMENINHRLAIEKHNVTYLISNNFALPSHQPYKVEHINDLFKSPIYLYKIT